MTTDASLTRLRRANPVAQAPTVDAPELFAQITSLPVDPRVTRSPRSRPAGHRRRLAAVAIALAVMAVLASTAFALSNWIGGGVAVAPKVTKHEYVSAQHQLTLPPGVTWPHFHMAPNTITGLGAGGGRAVGISQNAWECYWVDAIKKGDTAAQQRAHTELEALLDHNVIVAPKDSSENWTPPNPPQTPYTVFADDGGYQWLKAMYASAAAGHPVNLVSSCRANAPR